MSMTVQDERYLNHYIWREHTNASKKIRILSHSYLYPYRDDGFGDWVVKHNRPIIYHGIYKTPGKLTKGEIQLFVKSTKQCIGYFLRPKVGLFGCHGGGGMQGWVVETDTKQPISWPMIEFARLRQATTYATWAECLNGDVEPGQPARLSFCDRSESDAILWSYHSGTGHLVNKKSGLCLDAATKPPHKRIPTLMSSCSDAAEFQAWVGQAIESLKCTQSWCASHETKGGLH